MVKIILEWPDLQVLTCDCWCVFKTDESKSRYKTRADKYWDYVDKYPWYDNTYAENTYVECPMCWDIVEINTNYYSERKDFNI